MSGAGRGLIFIRQGEKSVRINRHDALERVQLIHIKSLNPVQDQQGLGCLDAASAVNSAIAAAVRKMKTTDGAFTWQNGMVAGQPSTLLGYPVIEAEDMPDVAAGSLSIAFGNFKAGYIITERAETSILRDPYSKKPHVYFYATLLLDALVHGCCPAAPSNVPPTSPEVGSLTSVEIIPAGVSRTS